MGIVLSVSDLSFSYEQGEPVWSGISLDVHAGEVLSILGPNGTGKSTLMRCMAGLAVPDFGYVELDGCHIHEMSRKKAALAIAFVPQMHTPVFAFSAIDVVVMGRTAHLGAFASPSAHDYEVSLQAMASFGIADLAEKPYNKTSGGERQLILFARAIAQEARILLLDEPTSHLDFGNQLRTLEIISNLANRGLAVVMTTHFPDHALRYSKRTALISGGSLQGFGLTESVVTPESLTSLYGLEVEINTFKCGSRVCLARP
ncbi:ABC transporter ATP-binding protein [Maridesulfovibrio sp.]|uniref:ABC transporter ATP-binding protein n=1 Tax=Maridesulfovibrio sp. TaxID=2795000 RepID=UPI0029F4B1C3|nr:ABC transporter ATP-binding protein [Maridesulfovibrio sp.]